jgi:hypothetical protein
MLEDESLLVIERLNGMEITRGNLLQNAIGSILSSKARTNFKKAMQALNVEVGPRGPHGKPLVSEDDEDEEE